MLKNYIKMALKVLLRRKGFTCISLFTISFTLMVLMVAASLFDHIFGSFPPETRSDRTLILQSVRGEGPGKGHSISSPSYAFLQRYVSSLTQAEKVSISKVGSSTETTFRKGEKIKFELKYTDGVFWEILEFDFLEGRPYTTKEVEEAQRVAVINQATRRAFFGEQAVGKYIELKGQPVPRGGSRAQRADVPHVALCRYLGARQCPRNGCVPALRFGVWRLSGNDPGAQCGRNAAHQRGIRRCAHPGRIPQSRPSQPSHWRP